MGLAVKYLSIGNRHANMQERERIERKWREKKKAKKGKEHTLIKIPFSFLFLCFLSLSLLSGHPL